jgi:tetratricopeptide (TPR) repeat protein
MRGNIGPEPRLRSLHACHPVGCSLGIGTRRHLQQSRQRHQSKGDYPRAIQDYDEAIRIDLDSALAFNNRGSAFQHMGNYDRAIQDGPVPFCLDPSSAPAPITTVVAPII